MRKAPNKGLSLCYFLSLNRDLIPTAIRPTNITASPTALAMAENAIVARTAVSAITAAMILTTHLKKLPMMLNQTS